MPGTAESRDASTLLIEIAQRLRVSTERARYLAQAVVAELAEAEPGLVDYLRMVLKSDLLDRLAPAGDNPDRSASIRSDVPTELTDTEVTRSLAKLPQWWRTHGGIARTVGLPDEQVEPLVHRVQQVAHDMNDHAHVSTAPGEVTFTLATGDGRITEADMGLAQRVDEAIMR